MRNCAGSVDRYWAQIHEFMDRMGPGYEWYISVYENDSTDNTAELISKLDTSRFVDYSIVSENLGTPAFGSVVAEERVKNLSNARNKALYAKDMVQNVDKVLWIEPDISYRWDLIDNLLHPERVGIEPDIYLDL